MDRQPPSELAGVDRQLGQDRPVCPPPLDCVRDGGSEFRMTAEPVEQVPLPALVQEPLLVVLAVDLDEPSGHLGQASGGRGIVVDPGARSAGGGNVAYADEWL